MSTELDSYVPYLLGVLATHKLDRSELTRRWRVFLRSFLKPFPIMFNRYNDLLILPTCPASSRSILKYRHFGFTRS